MKSELTYTILEQCDCNIITFLDTSTYVGEATNPVLRIFPPDMDTYSTMPYNKEAITLIKPSHLRFKSLTSGLYTFVQSICPNEQTEVTTCYLNVCNERDEIKKMACDCPTDELVDLLFELDIAQGIVSECPEKGVELLKIVRNKIKKLKNNCC